MKFKIDNIENLSDSREVMESKPNKFTSIFIYIVLALIVIFLLWAWFSKKEIVVKATGIVRPYNETYAISNVIAGEVNEINMKNGQNVSKGDILFKINSKDLEDKKKQLEDNKDYFETDIDNLKKLTKSINDNTNYFEDSRKEKEYYYKYKSYVAGNKVPLSDKDNISESKKDLQNEKSNLESLLRSVKDQKNYNESNSLYSDQYNSYISSRKVIENKIDQLKKMKKKLQENSSSEATSDQITQAEGEIKGNEDQLSKLESDTEVQIKASIDKINKNIKSLDNDLDKIDESNDIVKEKSKTTVLAQIEEKITADKEKLKEVNSSIKDINKNIEDCTVKASVGGKLDINMKLQPGVMIQTGAIVANILPGANKYKVDLIIPNNKIANIKDGEDIKYSFDALSYKEYGFIDGKIESISPDSKIDSEKGISFYTAEGSLDKNVLYSNNGEESFIKSGMTCEGRIITRKERMLYYLLEKLGIKN
ncbi:HlyD family efflux transporter periplasmic adaptor subunit [Clostridium sardiniense]|uniref:HlyD family efflux transporter periplasmic adaptor subunit n=1 Tax=Clostridium sardiniense TaxID=29369 RepID=UPI0019563ECF|nr:HlyD family efflux transporter periplasmic adaptor subunit [Clostridium sardiniense]MBM7833224.1 HlyD family secretion protein [Clostridium sardiniense]